MTSDAAREAVEALRAVAARLPRAEVRTGQIGMVVAVADAIAARRHAVVQAGTGTGKSLGYLVPAILSGRKTVVATATKALQDQLNSHDLPFLAEHLTEIRGEEFTWSVLKGRSNYVCLQRLEEWRTKDVGLDLGEDGPTPASLKREIDAVQSWAARTLDGDIESMTRAISERARRAVTVGADECPGRAKCQFGDSCWAEAARDSAREADVLVVNLHLYGLDAASGGAILPEHDLVILDEVHQLEAIVSDTASVDITVGRLGSFGSAARGVVAGDDVTRDLDKAADRLGTILSGLAGTRLARPLPAALADVLSSARLAVGDLLTTLKPFTVDSAADGGGRPTDARRNTVQRALRASIRGTRLAEGLDALIGYREGYVAYVEGTESRPVLRLSPLHVGETLRASVWEAGNKTAILTSATVPLALPARVGLPEDGTEEWDFPSPFDYENNSVLYCSPEFPDRNAPTFTPFVHDQLEALISAAGGRTLALFTSNAALTAAAAAMRERLDVPILTPADHPRQKLIEMFLADEASCIFASQSFFQGIDLPGRTLSLVVLDKLPFPRPDDPLLEARREAVGRDLSFRQIDLPICATSLAQAAGRLIRSNSDRGVVAVLDRRLAAAKYRWTLIEALPPMRKTRDRADVEQFLRSITSG